MQKQISKNLKDIEDKARHEFLDLEVLKSEDDGLRACLEVQKGLIIAYCFEEFRDLISEQIKEINDEIGKLIKEKKEFAESFGHDFKDLIFYSDSQFRTLHIRKDVLVNLLKDNDNGEL